MANAGATRTDRRRAVGSDSFRRPPASPPSLSATLKDFKNRLSKLLANEDPDKYSGPHAQDIVKDFGEIGRMVLAGTAKFSRRVESSGIWKESGESTCASHLATLEGVSRGQARSMLQVGRALAEFPLLEQRAREGKLSQAKLTELTNTLKAEPDAEATLLSAAGSEPLWSTKERCQRIRATSARRDPLAATRRIREGRHLTWWSDEEGAFCFQGRDTADRGALIRDRIEQLAGDLRRARRREEENAEGRRESDGALRIDALFSLLCDGRSKSVPPGRGGPPAGPSVETNVVERPPRCNLMVRVDLDALLRGRARSGECCEIDGQGPIPVPMARDLANDSFLRVLFHKADDIRAVSTLGRTVKRQLRIALAARDRCCVVPGCGAASGLGIDHVIPFSEGGPTELDNLALLCHHHHFLKTFDGWRLVRGLDHSSHRPIWRFEPPRTVSKSGSQPRAAKRAIRERRRE